jgi:hypothetical protein
LEAIAFKKHWKIVNDIEREELKTLPVMEKLGQMVALMSSGKALGWTKALAAEEKEVRERWIKLRKYYHV